MRNVTITLDEEVARWARIRAAESDTSVSRLVGDMLRKKMMEDKSYIVAIQKIESYNAENIQIADHELPIGRLFKHDVSKVLNASSAS